jgi:exodeoxyribonuclease VII small subunit
MSGGTGPEMATAEADLTFGEAMTRLEAVVGQLEENESLGLEQALALYEQGVALAEDCRQRLTAARLRLTEIAPGEAERDLAIPAL